MNGTLEGWLELFRYDRWATIRVVEVLEANPSPELEGGAGTAPLTRAGQLVAHLVRAQQVWLTRVRGSAVPTQLWPAWPSSGGPELVHEAGEDWNAFLATLNNSDLHRKVSYRNSQGTPFDTRLDRILQHVVNHGTHHRAQALELFRQAGMARPPLDFIVFVREEEAAGEEDGPPSG